MGPFDEPKATLHVKGLVFLKENADRWLSGNRAVGGAAAEA